MSNKKYVNSIPEAMNTTKLNDIYYAVFGCTAETIYMGRKLYEGCKRVTITDFAGNGFFWAQLDDDDVRQ